MYKECVSTRPVYQVSLNSQGEVVVIDPERNTEIPGDRFEFPIPSTEIIDVKNLTIVQAKGSHYILVCNGTTWKKYKLPH